MEFEFIQSIEQVSAKAWNDLWRKAKSSSASNYPFIQHEFLSALERANATTKETGWEPFHLTIKDQGILLGAMPLYIKYHSYGEYVFDWSWAEAYAKHGLNYYPKLLNAIPFTPATGPRLALSDDIPSEEQEIIFSDITRRIEQLLIQISASSFHGLLPEKENQRFFDRAFRVKRLACQFHWYNNNYTSFDDFLSRFKSRKRKSIKKERQQLQQQGIEFQTRFGYECSQMDIAQFYFLYRNTYLKLSGHQGYLSQKFFELVFNDLSNSVIMITAHKGCENFFAASLFFIDSDTLYGRYWGTEEDLNGLHFETCYYQGIEFAIEHKLKRFDPGAQGEHKIQRGFYPVKTCSYHLIKHPDFNLAVKNFVEEEKEHIEDYINAAQEYLPFNCDTRPISADDLLSWQ